MRPEFEKLTLLPRLDRLQARQTERTALASKCADATRTFYVALTPEEQMTLDEESKHFAPA